MRFQNQALFLACLALVGCEQDRDCEALQESYRATAGAVAARIETERAADRISGITYAAHNEGCILFSGVSGTGDAEGTQSLDAGDSLFRVASVSKLFASLATAQLIETGNLGWDSSLTDLERADFVRRLHREESPERLARWGAVRIEHMMSHQSGISKDLPGAYAFFNSFAIEDHSYPTHAELRAGLGRVEFLYPAGQVPTGIKYSNLAMNLLARVVEAYNPRGLDFADYVEAEILAPSGMRHTRYDLAPWESAKLTTSYGSLVAGRPALPKVYFTGSYDGSIGIASSAEDLARFGMQLLRLASFERAELLRDPETIRTYLTPKSAFAANLAWANGPSWQILPGERLEDPLWFGHTGTGYGERAIVVVSPEKDLGVVALFNANDAFREKYAKIISDAIATRNPSLGARTADLLASVRAFLRMPPPAVPGPVLPAPDRRELERFVGNYFADVVGNQAVSIGADGHLVFYGNRMIPEDVAAGKFRFPPGGGVLFNSEPLQFEFDAFGRVAAARAAQVKRFERRDP